LPPPPQKKIVFILTVDKMCLYLAEQISLDGTRSFQIKHFKI